MSKLVKKFSILSIALLPLLYILYNYKPSTFYLIQRDSELLLAAEKCVDRVLAKLKSREKTFDKNVPDAENQKIPSADDMPPLPEVPYLTSQDLPRLLGRGDHEKILKLVSILDELVESVDGKLIMHYGTLLGSYMCHDILPWDDDVDFLITVSSKEKLVKKLQEGKNGIFWDVEHWISSEGTLKMWFKDSPNAGKFKWKFPFIDAWFLDYNETHVWSYDKPSARFTLPVSDIFPLHKRPLGHLFFNSPRKVRQFLKNGFKRFICISHYWDHRNELAKQQHTAPCTDLKKYYPHVLRHELPYGVKETLVIDGKPFYALNISEEYEGDVEPFTL